METEIKHKVYDTKTGDCYIVTLDNVERKLVEMNKKYGFNSTSKVLNKTLHISPIGKPVKYFNEFNEADQQEISDWINS